MKFKSLLCDRIAMEGIKLMEEKGCEVARAWNLPKTELPKIIGENDAIIMRSATRVKAELIGKARKLTVVDALERPAS